MRRCVSVVVVVLLGLVLVGCEDFFDPASSSDDSARVTDEVAQVDDTATAPTAPELSGAPFSFSEVTWLHTDVSSWAQTASLDARVADDRVILDYDKANEWPDVENVVASAWVFFNLDGNWYGSTFDYLRPGQTVKEAGFWIPIGGRIWKPGSGEEIGFMVSGLARDDRRNVYERSNVDMVVWP